MKPGVPQLQSTRLLDQVRERIQYLHHSLKTEKAYLYWICVLHPLERCARRGHAASARDGRERCGGIPVHDGQRAKGNWGQIPIKSSCYK